MEKTKECNTKCCDDACTPKTKCEVKKKKRARKTEVYNDEQLHHIEGTDNVVAEELKNLKAAHKANIERAQREIKLMREQIEALNLIVTAEDIDTPNSQGLAPFNAVDFAHNLLVADPRRGVKDLTDTLLREYSLVYEELRPTFVDYMLYPFVAARRLSIRRWKSSRVIIDNLNRIKAILGNEVEGDEVGVNLNNFATYVSYLQVIRPNSSSAIFKCILNASKNALSRSEKLLSVSRSLQ